jgi:hypothetical protein
VVLGTAAPLARCAGDHCEAARGQRSDGTYTSGNITQYKEGDTINFRFDLTGSDTASGQLQVRFTENDGTCLFFANYFVLGAVTNVSGATPTVGVASGPTADSGEWVVTLNVDFAAAGEAIVDYQLKLSNQAGDCTGSSQHSRLNAGDGVSQTGQQNVPIPAKPMHRAPEHHRCEARRPLGRRRLRPCQRR